MQACTPRSIPRNWAKSPAHPAPQICIVRRPAAPRRPRQMVYIRDFHSCTRHHRRRFRRADSCNRDRKCSHACTTRVHGTGIVAHGVRILRRQVVVVGRAIKYIRSNCPGEEYENDAGENCSAGDTIRVQSHSHLVQTHELSLSGKAALLDSLMSGSYKLLCAAAKCSHLRTP